jgi:hypothetical protein
MERTVGAVEVQLYSFLTSALVGREVSASRLDHFFPVPRACSTYYILGPIHLMWSERV